MNKYDFVKLKVLSKEYLDKHLNLAEGGNIILVDGDRAKVLFCNSYNKGDFAIVWVKLCDLEVVQEKHSKNFIALADKFFEFALERESNHSKLCPIKFQNVDFVEVIVDKPQYLKFGIKKGTRGFVAVDDACNFKTLVDFSGAKGVTVNQGQMELIEIDIRDIKNVSSLGLSEDKNDL